MGKLKYLFLLIFLSKIVFAQQFTIQGKIADKRSFKPLSFANIRIEGTNRGTAANLYGDYLLNLSKGNYTLIASYIGYKSDTIKVNLNGNKKLNFLLNKITLKLPEVTVKPGKNPALKIIENTIIAKHKRDSLINSYTFLAYTKGLIRTTREIDATDKSVNLTAGLGDTNKLKITGIIENESKGYFKKPNHYKEEIIARRQTANTPSSINVFTGGRLIQNFYNETVQYFGRPLPSPIADNALNYYYFYIEDTLAMDNLKVFKIYFAPANASDPGLYGRIFIADSIFSLLKVVASINKAANPGSIFNDIRIFQQFSPFQNNIYMPIDYRIFLEGNYLGLVRFGFELNTILHDYEINIPIKDDFFDMAVVTVLPGADKKDSTYWNYIKVLPYTKQEARAYHRIDSLQHIPKSFWDNFSFFSTRIGINKNLSVSGPLSIYSFNKISGHKVNLGLYTNDLLDKRLYSSLIFGYGFSSKKFTFNLNSTYFMGDYRTYSLKLNIHNDLKVLFEQSDNYNKLTSTILSLFTKYDFRNYYYSKGFGLKLSAEVLPFLKLNLGFTNRIDNSAFNNTNFSFFKRDKQYGNNQIIYDSKLNYFSGGFGLDFRKYIEDGYFRRKISRINYILLNGEFTISKNSIIKSDTDFNTYTLNVYGTFRTFKSAVLNFRINGFYSTGTLPLQMMYSLPGNINASSKSFSFRTLRFGEVFGNRLLTVNLEHNFRDELFNILRIPFIKNLQIQLGTHLNIAWINTSFKNKTILPLTSQSFNSPFIEAGFSLGHVLLPFKLEFTWKLNHLGRNNFVFGINTFAL